MKKAGLLCMVVLLAAALSGCGSKESRSVDSLIEAIGPVDADCGPVVEYVRKEYEMLSQEDRAKVKHYNGLLQAEAAYVDALIDAIGDVSSQSVQGIEKAELAYENLETDAQALVTGLEDLQNMKAVCREKAMLDSVSGVWVNEVLGSTAAQVGSGLIRSYGLDETNCDPASNESGMFELKENGEVLYGQTEWGTWCFSTDFSGIILEGPQQYSLQVQEEDGFIKLVGAVFENQPFGYVREENYVQAFQQKYAAASLTQNNVHQYIADPELIGAVEQANGGTGKAYIYPSKAYEEGLAYIGSACTIQVDYDHGGRAYHFFLDYPVISITKLKMKDVKINTDTRISGEIYYVKNEYVEKNYINEDGFRVLELTNGVSMVFDGYSDTLDTFWNRVDASYSDYMY